MLLSVRLFYVEEDCSQCFSFHYFNMTPSYQNVLILAAVIIIPVFCGVQVIPERGNVISMNEKYFHNFSFFIKRYSRNSGYYINVEASMKQEWNNNVTFNLVFNEYLHNEYRRSFVELHYKFCDLLKSEKFIAPTIRKYGVKCPLPPGNYRFMNMTFPLDEFPNVFPYERARIDIEYTVTDTKESMAKVYFYALFKNKIP